MSNCLNEARIRAAADGEANASERQHLGACGDCRARVDAARRAADQLAAMVATVTPPASLHDAVRRAVLTSRHGGATTLRDTQPFRPFPRTWAMACLAAAAVLVVIFALPPFDAPRAISAAEILDRSLQTFSPTSGIERREFDLELQLPRVASMRNGTYRIEQLIDHDTPGRYRFVRYGADGTLLEAVSEDPASGRRTVVIKVDGQPFAFRLATAPNQTLALRDLERQHVEAVVRVLQATAGQTVREVNHEGGKRYIVELPKVADANGSRPWELNRARVVIDAADYQILEFAAGGSYMGDSVSVLFRLRQRQVWSSAEVPSSQFDAPEAEHAITIEGVATEDFGRDLLAGALRALSRSRQ